MGKNRVKGKHLKEVDFPSNVAKSLAIELMTKHFKHVPLDEKLAALQTVLSNPEAYLNDAVFQKLAIAICGQPQLKTEYEVFELKTQGLLNVFGEQHIAINAKQQMEAAMTLPIAVKGALMPDAHHGYGLPIGGVLAAKNAVIPFGVGLDIGCRMALSIFDAPTVVLKQKAFELQKALKRYTHFGNEGTLDTPTHHDVLDNKAFKATGLLKHLHGKARYQLGSSGTGNHFVEFGEVEVYENNNLGLPRGSYLGLLSHSGSRGMGANIADTYTKLAINKCRLPQHMRSMAWLSLDSEEGQEYWLSMNLAGDYAKACHDVIHQQLSKVMGFETLRKVENHHNFAWKEIHDGEELIVHRKGATPAALGELGIIPGSMCSKGYIVSGLGHAPALNSASHGAGRRWSRKEAHERITKSSMTKQLSEQRVHLMGGSVEEASAAYKDIEQVMSCQTNLVKVEGHFTPRIVRMNKD